MWPKVTELEGRGEIFLHWHNLAAITLVIVIPLIVALFFDSLWVKIICWAISLLAYMSYLPVQGPCVQAVAVSILPWYVLFEWRSAPKWLAIIAALISLIEISYVRHRMRAIKEMRKKEGILL